MDPTHPDYATVITIAQAITNAAGGPDALLRTLGHVLRDSIDDVVKTPKTGRRFYDELQNSEKTYIGTCIEINLRSALELPRGRTLDLHIAGHEVDVKFSAGTAWMIPPEAVGHPCVLITATEATARCSFGVFLAKHEYLNAPNRDQKRSISAAGRANVLWILRDAPYPQNFWQTVPKDVVQKIADGRSGNERMMTLFREIMDRPISRKVVQDVAEQEDFTRRVRADRGRPGTRDSLLREGILLLSGAWKRDQDFIRAVGLPKLTRTEYMSHRLRPSDFPIARQLGFRL